MKYIYQDHLGGHFYTSDMEYDFDYLYCDSCGDSDTYVGEAETRKEAWILLNQYKSYYDIKYLREFVKDNFSRRKGGE